MALDMLGIEAVPLPCDPGQGFVPDLAETERRIDGRTRAIVLVTPNNPTGAIYPPERIAAFCELCRRRGIVLILDETYRDFLSGPPHGLFADCPWRDTLIALYSSFSKAYCIPGHRLGTLVAGEAAMAEIVKIFDTVQICAPRTAQAPIAWAIDNLAAWREENRLEIARRADVFTASLRGLNGWRIDSLGAYFAFLRHPFPDRRSAEVVRILCETQGVLCLPGPYFGPGLESHMRVAFANAGVPALSSLRQRFAGLA
jgi:aspartate/methionine/tyrosine aminotransferase